MTQTMANYLYKKTEKVCSSGRLFSNVHASYFKYLKYAILKDILSFQGCFHYFIKSMVRSLYFFNGENTFENLINHDHSLVERVLMEE